MMEGKKYVKELLFIIAIIIGLTLFVLSIAKAGVDVAVTGNLGYNGGTWESGLLPSPTGTERDTSIGYGGAVQVIYNRWKFKPTIEVSGSYYNFDFSTNQAPTQYAKPLMLSFRAGVTRDFKLFEAYGLVGYSWVWTKAELIENVGDRWLDHGRHTIREHGISFKFGAYRLINLYGIKVGPELSVEGFPKSLGFSRCREFSTWNFVPYVGIRVQF